MIHGVQVKLAPFITSLIGGPCCLCARYGEKKNMCGKICVHLGTLVLFGVTVPGKKRRKVRISLKEVIQFATPPSSQNIGYIILSYQAFVCVSEENIFMI